MTTFSCVLEKNATRTVPFGAVLAFLLIINNVLSKFGNHIIQQLETHCLQRPTIHVTSGHQRHCSGR